MKKFLVVLVAMVCFGFSANAEANPNVYVSGTPIVTINKNETVTIEVPIKANAIAHKTGCTMAIKVCPITRNILDALFIQCEYGEIKLDCLNNNCSGTTIVKFNCSVKQNASAPRCGAYDFAVTITNDGC
jgi:hypothetical protein